MVEARVGGEEIERLDGIVKGKERVGVRPRSGRNGRWREGNKNEVERKSVEDLCRDCWRCGIRFQLRVGPGWVRREGVTVICRATRNGLSVVANAASLAHCPVSLSLSVSHSLCRGRSACLCCASLGQFAAADAFGLVLAGRATTR